MALLIADYDRHQNPVDIHFNLGGRVLRLIPLLSGGVCAGDEHQATEGNNWVAAIITFIRILLRNVRSFMDLLRDLSTIDS